jgi:hypothetical protein
MIVPCPYCSEPLYETAQIENSPFTTYVGMRPEIRPEGNDAIMLCHHCKRKIYLIKAGNGYHPSPVQPKE